MSEEMQALCYFAGANSIFYGEKLLTTSNPEANADRALFNKLGISALGGDLADQASEAPLLTAER